MHSLVLVFSLFSFTSRGTWITVISLHSIPLPVTWHLNHSIRARVVPGSNLDTGSSRLPGGSFWLVPHTAPEALLEDSNVPPTSACVPDEIPVSHRRRTPYKSGLEPPDKQQLTLSLSRPKVTLLVLIRHPLL